MASGEKDSDSSALSTGKWFLSKLIKTPAVYLGTVIGIAAGITIAGVSGPWAGVFTGTFLGIAATALTWLASTGIRASHIRSKAMELAEEAERTAALEQSALNTLREAGHNSDAELLEKIFQDRDAIVDRARDRGDFDSEDVDTEHTLELVSAIVARACAQSEELHDLVRRLEDPLLKSPAGADQKIAELRADLTLAYQAVANARSRFRRGEKLAEIDFLADTSSLSSLNLAALAGKLQEETELSRRVEERLQIDPVTYEGPVDYGDPIDDGSGERLRESE